tara:strand:- start:1634 stop:4057 length:2424 start_codon:yes stop_codon:yes gene_type:complete
MGASVKTISIIVAANIKGLEVGLGKANKSLAKFASGAARMGSLLSFGVTAPLTALGKSAFDTFSQFENGMMKVNTVTGATVDEFKMLTDEAKRLGATTQFTALQVADLQLVLGRKGFDPTAIKNMEKSVLDLALATGEDLSLAADTVASSINAFGLSSNEASRVANTLASAAANSSVQLSTFSTAFGHAGASANAVGVELEELSAMMGVLMDNGIKASKAGTGLRKVFMKLHKEGRSFSEILDLVTQGNFGLEQAQKLVGVTAANQILILAKNKDKVAELTQEYQTNTGRLDEMAEAMGGTTFAKVKKMESAIEGMKLEMGALIADAILPIIQKVTELASSFQGLDGGTKKLILQIAGIAAVLGPLLLTISLATAAWGAMTSAIALVTGGIKLLTLAIMANPLGALAVVVTSLAASWLIFRDNNREANKELDETQTKAKKAADRLAEINKELDRSGKSSLDLKREELEESLKPLKEKAKILEDELKNVQKAFKETGDLELMKRLAVLSGEYREVAAKANTYISTLNRITKLEKEQELALNGTNIEVENLTDNYKDVKTAAQGYMDALETSEPDVDIPQLRGGRMEMPEPTISLSKLEEGLFKAGDLIGRFFEKWGESIKMVGSIFSNMLNNKMIALDNYHKRETEAIATSGMNSKDQAAAQERLDKQVAENKAKLQRKAAIAEKMSAISSAVMNTALAITKTLGELGFLGIPMSSIVAGLGAVQVATIAAQPIPQFADGGVVSGPTLGLMGEYSGARSNPEVIAPLDRLKTIIGDTGSSSPIIPDLRIKGDDLLIIFDRANRRKNRR